MSIETANIVTWKINGTARTKKKGKGRSRAEIEREKQNKRKDKYILDRKTIMKTI